MSHARFEKFVEPEPNTGCHLWVGSLNQAGYGQFYNGSRIVLAHRHVLGLDRALKDQSVDHKCNVRCCVNPAHLQIVSRSRNIWLAFNRDRRPTKPRQPFCKSGRHRMEGENVIDCNGRTCRACKNERQRRG